MNHTGQFAEAIDKYTKALRFHPDQLDCLVNRARCYMMQGQLRFCGGKNPCSTS
ncbi:hypothetical protein BCR33DRAFT_716089 [Rhizoclosmatium globosum]|uniref:Uncharacterized protein n=1 Tax=Rhizoclosmatium globosum TaxID=329046 RepID=A0A1Y2CGP1_9FUNG|nr:hypothetical protein BCR33DRAFT_716089 [Rhizoclosmatium globosum]|eukprot:ORY46087.1 hypothetical protein BCR33DRAFT_716089 [Rhizoclosmatium globosum]